MNTSHQNLARALQQGLRLLRLLDDGEANNLEGLAVGAGLAKSSALRLLATLEHEDLVVRDPKTKAYRAQVRLAPLLYKRSREAEIRRRLTVLSEETGLTSEWWARRPKGMCLVYRHAPADQELRIHAQIGFVFPRDRLEVIPALEHACRLGDAFPAGTVTWADDGRQRRCTAAERRQVLSWATTGRSYDRQANAMGVRRLAALIVGGCLTIAVPPMPPIADIDAKYGDVFDRHHQALQVMLEEEQ